MVIVFYVECEEHFATALGTRSNFARACNKHVKRLGTDPIYFGSVIKMLVHQIMHGGADPVANLAELFSEVRVLYAQNKVRDRFTVWRPTMIHPATSKVPKLKGKVGTIKSIGPILRTLFKRHMDTTNALHNLVLEGLELSLEIDRILSESRLDYRLLAPAAEEIQRVCFEYCRVETTLVRMHTCSQSIVYIIHVVGSETTSADHCVNSYLCRS